MKESTQFNSKKPKYVLGIDLGTTNSVVSIHLNGIPTVLKSKSGEITPTCIMFNDETFNNVSVGREPYKVRDKENVVYSVKQFMGHTDRNITAVVNNKTKQFNAKEICKLFISKLYKEVIELNPEYNNIKDVVISHPAYFRQDQIQDTKAVFTELGFNVINVNQEPTSAALLYKYVKVLKSDIVVFDLGGGTFDTVLISNSSAISENTIDAYKVVGIDIPQRENILEVKDIDGNNNLGGDTVNDYAFNLLLEEYPSIKDFKFKLIPCINYVKESGNDLQYNVNNTALNIKYEIIQKAMLKVVEECLVILKRLLLRNNLGTKDAHIVLCGGSTKSKLLQQVLIDNGYTISSELDADLAVAEGNSIYGERCINGEASVMNRTPYNIGVYVSKKFTPIIRKSEVIPISRTYYAVTEESYVKDLIIELYSTPSLSIKPERIADIRILDLPYEEDGKVKLALTVYIKYDNTIEAIAETKTGKYKTVIGLVENIKSDLDKYLKVLSKVILRVTDKKLLAEYEKVIKSNDVDSIKNFYKKVRK